MPIETPARPETGRPTLSGAVGVITGDDGERNRPCEDRVVSEQLLSRAARGDEEAFRELTDPHRGELQLHCYRILGSVPDAEDALQETLLGAWRGLGRFEARASLRAWLYRIATNRCLDALRDAGRRPPAAIVAWWTGQGRRLVPSRANTQPAFGCYRNDADAPIARATGLIVLTLEGERIAAITQFLDSGVLARFGLPRTLHR
jgi:RNA polymerase sigma factor (sigma-70 family)